jgi:hypothetical protein
MTRAVALVAVALVLSACRRESERRSEAGSDPSALASSAQSDGGVDASIEAGPPAPPTPPTKAGVAIPASVPTGDVNIVHECRQSGMPWSKKSWHRETVYDLANATATSVEGENDGARTVPDPARSLREKKHTSKLSAARVSAIRQARDAVLRSGPYQPERARPEGMLCRLSLRVANDPPFFSIDKARTEIDDEITALVHALGD